MKPGPKPDNRTEHVHVRLTPQEREALEAAAKQERRTLSEYLVVAALERAKR